MLIILRKKIKEIQNIFSTLSLLQWNGKTEKDIT